MPGGNAGGAPSAGMPGSASSSPGASASMPGGSQSAPGASAPGASAPGASAPGASAPGASAPGASAPGANSGRGSSAGRSDSRPQGQTGEGEQTASSNSDGAAATGESSDDISFEEPDAAGRANGRQTDAADGEQADAADGQQAGAGGGDLSVDAAVDDQVLQEAFDVFGAQGKTLPGQQSAGEGQGKGGPSGSGSASAAGGTANDRLGELNAELDSALGGFDGVILAERDAAKSDANDRANGGDKDTGDDATEEDGGDFGGGFSIPAMPTGSAPAASQGNQNSNGNGTQPARAGANRKGDYQHANAADAVPADIPDGSDDDVVARQIREAAQRETDPELREKLWDEYRKYKKDK